MYQLDFSISSAVYLKDKPPLRYFPITPIINLYSVVLTQSNALKHIKRGYQSPRSRPVLPCNSMPSKWHMNAVANEWPCAIWKAWKGKEGVERNRGDHRQLQRWTGIE